MDKFVHYGYFNIEQNITLNKFLKIITKPSNVYDKITIVEGWSREDLQKEAFTALKKQSTMEQTALWAQMCLQINRCDLAEQSFKKLEAIDEDATLTQLVGAWINLHKGGDNTKEAAYTYEELIDKFGASQTLLNGLASALMHMGRFDEAEKQLIDRADGSQTFDELVEGLPGDAAELKQRIFDFVRRGVLVVGHAAAASCCGRLWRGRG